MVAEDIKLLIISDDPTRRTALKQAFGEESTSITVARSDAEAIERIDRDHFQMIVIGMPLSHLKTFESVYGQVWHKIESTPFMLLAHETPMNTHHLSDSDRLTSNQALIMLDSKAASHARRINKEFKIIGMLRDRELHIKELNHRIKNNLQTIVSLLNIQSMHMHDNSCLQMLQAIQFRIQTIAMIYEALYESESIGEIDFSAYARGLVNSIFKVFVADPGRVRMLFEIQPVILEKDIAMHCGLILNELVTNSLKYAFSDGRIGEVAVSLKIHTDGRIEMSVKDNGIGLPENLNMDGEESMGLLLVNALVQQIHGTLTVERTNGTGFQVAFRRPEQTRVAI